MMQVISEFNYRSLTTETRIVVQQRTSEIRSIMKRTAQDTIEIGEKLLEVKDLLGHGSFGDWLASEFGWSWRTANTYMAVAAKFANLSNLDSIAPSALYLLASDSTPEEVKQEFIHKAELGEKITHKEVKGAIDAKKPQQGEKLTVVEPAHPLHGEVVTVAKADGDIVYCETSEGTKPIAFGWLATEDDLYNPPEQKTPKNPQQKTSLSELLEATELALELSRERCEKLQEWCSYVCSCVDLPPHLREMAVELGIS